MCRHPDATSRPEQRRGARASPAAGDRRAPAATRRRPSQAGDPVAAEAAARHGKVTCCRAPVDLERHVGDRHRRTSSPSWPRAPTYAASCPTDRHRAHRGARHAEPGRHRGPARLGARPHRRRASWSPPWTAAWTSPIPTWPSGGGAAPTAGSTRTRQHATPHRPDRARHRHDRARWWRRQRRHRRSAPRPGRTWIAARVFNDAGAATTTAVHQAFQWLLDPDARPGDRGRPSGRQRLVVPRQRAGLRPVLPARRPGPARRRHPAGLRGRATSGPAPRAASARPTTPSRSPWVRCPHQPRLLGQQPRSRPPAVAGPGAFPDLVAPGVEISTTDRYGLFQSLSRDLDRRAPRGRSAGPPAGVRHPG